MARPPPRLLQRKKKRSPHSSRRRGDTPSSTPQASLLGCARIRRLRSSCFVTYKPDAGPITGPLFAWGPASTRERRTEQAPEPLLAGFGQPRRVLVAGATGFMGRHLVRRLLGRGHQLRALARRPPRGSWGGDVEWWPADVTAEGSLHGAAGLAWTRCSSPYDT